MVRGTVPLSRTAPARPVRRARVPPKAAPAADAAKPPGAEYVGFEDMIAKLPGRWADFDVAVATPEADGRSAQARQGARAARPDAQPEDRHRH